MDVTDNIDFDCILLSSAVSKFLEIQKTACMGMDDAQSTSNVFQSNIFALLTC